MDANTAVAQPRQLSVAKKPFAHLTVDQRTAIAHQVLGRYLDGEQVAEMAPEFKVSDVTLYALLLREHQDDWVEVQRARALARLERSQHKLNSASDQLSLARAREEVRAAQWELERLLRRLYGQDQPANLSVPIQINIGIERTQKPTVEAQVIDKTD